MKDVYKVLVIVVVLMIAMVGFMFYLFKPSPELSAQCGPGTHWNPGTANCVPDTGAPAGPGEGPSVPITECNIEDTTLNFRVLQQRTKGVDGPLYINLSYEAWQFGQKQGDGIAGSTVGVRASGDNSYDADITTLTPQFPVTVWYGDDSTGGPSTADYYYTSTSGDMGCQAAISITGKGYQEGADTYTYYDGGTYEATANESVSASETITDSYFKVQESAADGYLGNPDVTNPVGFCFGYNNTQINSMRIVDGTSFPVPSALGGTADECWQWTHAALFDYQTATVDFIFEMKSTFSDTASASEQDGINIYEIEKSWFAAGDGTWTLGWENDADTLVGCGDSTSDLAIDLY